MANERRYIGPRGTNPNATVPYEDAHKLRVREEDLTADYLINKVAGSLTIDTDNEKLLLSGDVASPGANKVYGTDALGVRTWRDAPAGTGEGGGVTTVPIEYLVTATGGETSVDCTSVWPTSETFFVALFRNGQRLSSPNDFSVTELTKSLDLTFSLLAGDVIQVLINEPDGGIVVNNQVIGATKQIHVYTATGGETSVDCTSVWPSVSNYSMDVFVNGMYQTPTTDCSIDIANHEIDLTYELEAGDVVFIVMTQYASNVVVTSYTSHLFTATASQTDFDLTSFLPSSSYMLLVSRNGVVQAETEDYTVTDGVLTFGEACSEGTLVFVQCMGVNAAFGETFDFVDLGDTPANYTGMGSKLVAVKADESGLELVDPPESSSSAASLMLQLLRYSGEDVTEATDYESIFEIELFGSALRHATTLQAFLWHTVDAGVTGRGKIEISDGTHTVSYETDVISAETKQYDISLDVSTLDDLADDAMWTLTFYGKVVSGTGNYTVKRLVVKSEPVSVFSETTIINSSPDAPFTGITFTHLQDTYIPYSFMYDSNSKIRCIAKVDGACTIRFRITANNGVESDYTDLDIVAASAGIVEGYASLPSVVSSVLKFTTYGQAGEGLTQTLQHYECWMET